MLMTQYSLIGIGNAPIDAIVSVKSDFLSRNGMEEGALTVINAETRDSMLAQLDPKNITLIPGGGSANVCSVFSAMGGKAGFQGRVGIGENGTFFIESLKRLGVETSAIYRDPEHGTMFIIIPITENGERSFAAYYGTTGRLGPDNLDLDMIKASKAIYIEGFNLISPHSFDAYKAAIEAVRSVGGKVFFGVSDKTIIQNYTKEVPFLIEAADMVFMNRVEAETLSGESDMNAILKTLLRRGLSAVITRGEEDVYILDGKTKTASLHAIERPLGDDEVVNMNGAGDAFTGGFLYGQLHGYDIESSVRMGCRCAIQIIKSIGPRPETTFSNLIAA